MFPGSTLGAALQPVLRSDGATDLSIMVDRFHEQFAADVPTARAARMAATQRAHPHVTAELIVAATALRAAA